MIKLHSQKAVKRCNPIEKSSKAKEKTCSSEQSSWKQKLHNKQKKKEMILCTKKLTALVVRCRRQQQQLLLLLLLLMVVVVARRRRPMMAGGSAAPTAQRTDAGHPAGKCLHGLHGVAPDAHLLVLVHAVPDQPSTSAAAAAAVGRQAVIQVCVVVVGAIQQMLPSSFRRGWFILCDWI
jgi:hypothetical protein